MPQLQAVDGAYHLLWSSVMLQRHRKPNSGAAKLEGAGQAISALNCQS